MIRYPGEDEYLWVPCSFVQPQGPAVLEMVVCDNENSTNEDLEAEGLITV